MAGLQPKEAQYGDQTMLRRSGLKFSPETQSPVFFNPQGGRPPEAGAPPGGEVPMLGGAQQATPPVETGIAPEHQSLYQQAVNLASASQAWQAYAASPLATPRTRRIAAALKEAARIAIYDARHGTPFVRGM